jgi:hypothetical protein
MKFETVYAHIRNEGEPNFYIFDCYKDHFDIALAELLPALKEDLKNIQRLNSFGFDGGDRRLPISWVIDRILEKVPMEWWRPLDIEALVLEQELRRLG